MGWIDYQLVLPAELLDTICELKRFDISHQQMLIILFAPNTT